MNHHRMKDPGARGVLAALTATLVLTGSWRAADANAQTSTAADERAATSAGSPRAGDIGAATESWLALQRSNAAAAPALPTPGAQATLAYERYMSSFRTQIPASFGSTLSGRNDGSRGGDASDGSGAAQSPDGH